MNEFGQLEQSEKYPEELFIPPETFAKFRAANTKRALCSHRAEKLWTQACESRCIENGPLIMLPENTLGKGVERAGCEAPFTSA